MEHDTVRVSVPAGLVGQDDAVTNARHSDHADRKLHVVDALFTLLHFVEIPTESEVSPTWIVYA